MSQHLIETYTSLIDPNDPKKTFFIETILPSLIDTNLSNDNENLDENRSKIQYSCPICKKKYKFLNIQSPTYPTQDMNTYTSFQSYTDHLTKMHATLLPCNGQIFSLSKSPSKLSISRSTTTSPRTSVNHELTNKSHQKLESTKMFKCIECNQSFARKEHLHKHQSSQKHSSNLQRYKNMIQNQNTTITNNDAQPCDQQLLETNKDKESNKEYKSKSFCTSKMNASSSKTFDYDDVDNDDREDNKKSMIDFDQILELLNADSTTEEDCTQNSSFTRSCSTNSCKIDDVECKKTIAKSGEKISCEQQISKIAQPCLLCVVSDDRNDLKKVSNESLTSFFNVQNAQQAVGKNSEISCDTSLKRKLDDCEASQSIEHEKQEDDDDDMLLLKFIEEYEMANKRRKTK